MWSVNDFSIYCCSIAVLKRVFAVDLCVLYYMDLLNLDLFVSTVDQFAFQMDVYY